MADLPPPNSVHAFDFEEATSKSKMQEVEMSSSKLSDLARSRWWQLKYFLFSPRKLGKWSLFWRAYFSKGLKLPTRNALWPKRVSTIHGRGTFRIFPGLRVNSVPKIHPKNLSKGWCFLHVLHIWKNQVGIFTFIYGCFLIGKLGSWAVVKGASGWLGCIQDCTSLFHGDCFISPRISGA